MKILKTIMILLLNIFFVIVLTSFAFAVTEVYPYAITTLSGEGGDFGVFINVSDLGINYTLETVGITTSQVDVTICHIREFNILLSNSAIIDDTCVFGNVTLESGHEYEITVTSTSNVHLHTSAPLPVNVDILTWIKGHYQGSGANYSTQIYQIQNITITSLGVTPPSFTNNQTNSTSTTPKINDILQLNITVTDDIDIDTIILSTNLTGTLKNTSSIVFIDISDTNVIAIFNLTINMTRGLMSYQYWVNDSYNNVNVSQIFTVSIKNSIPTVPIIYSPYDNEINNTRKIIFSSTDNDNDIITYQIYINDILNITTTTNITIWNGSSGNYSLKINAFDDYDNSGNSSVIYFTLDVIIPIIISFLPLEDNTSVFENDGSIKIQLSGTDNRDLAFFKINITREWDNLLKFNYSNSSLSGIYFTYSTNINITNWDNVTFIEAVKLCDSHSLFIIPKADIINKKYNELFFDFSGTKVYIKSINGNELYTDTKKLYDRYTTEFYYSIKTSFKVYELTSNKNIRYLPYSEYKGHFIINNYVWIDFHTNSKVTIEKTEKGYLIYIYNNDDNVIFNSIGLLNCVIESYKFNLSEIPILPPPPTLAEVVTNTNVILLYTLFIFIELFFLFLGFKYEQNMMVFLSCLMGVLISISFIKFVNLNSLFQNSVVIFIFINIIIIMTVGTSKLN